MCIRDRRVTVPVRNTGDYDTVETVQVYFRDVVASCTLPEKRLIGFRKVPLKSGELREVVFEFPTEAFSFVNTDLQRVTEPGEFELMVGKSSADITSKLRFSYTD